VNDLQCAHCGGRGAEIGPFEDTHVDVVECIEALRNQLREQAAMIQQLQEQIRFLAAREQRQAA